MQDLHNTDRKAICEATIFQSNNNEWISERRKRLRRLTLGRSANFAKLRLQLKQLLVYYITLSRQIMQHDLG